MEGMAGRDGAETRTSDSGQVSGQASGLRGLRGLGGSNPGIPGQAAPFVASNSPLAQTSWASLADGRTGQSGGHRGALALALIKPRSLRKAEPTWNDSKP